MRESIEALNRKLIEGVVGPLGLDSGLGTPEMVKSLTAGIARDTGRWLEIQNRYYRRRLELWAAYALHRPEARAQPMIEPDPADRRFRSPEWKTQPYFEYVTQSYLLAGQWLREVVDNTRLEPHAKKKLEFFTRQFIDAMSPANYPWTNPEALKLANETEGESATRGMRNLAADLEKGMVSMTDETAFEVGRDLATTPGAVVHRKPIHAIDRVPRPPRSGVRVSAGNACRPASQVRHPRPATGETRCALRRQRGTPCSWFRGATCRPPWAVRPGTITSGTA